MNVETPPVLITCVVINIRDPIVISIYNLLSWHPPLASPIEPKFLVVDESFDQWEFCGSVACIIRNSIRSFINDSNERGYFLAFFSAVLASALPCTTVNCCVMNNFGHHNQLSSAELYSHHVATNDFSMFDYFFINNMKVKALTWFYSRERQPLNNRTLARTQKLCRLSIQLSKCDSSYLT